MSFVDLEAVNIDTQQLVRDFRQVATMAGVNLAASDVEIEELPAPHRPPSRLPHGKMSVYLFAFHGGCLKVGKVGPRSQARYVSHHYNPRSSMSNLAKSLLNAKDDLGIVGLDDRSVGDWIKINTTRINFLLPNALGIPVLTLLEAFLQCRLRPRFEGFENQR